MPSYTSKEIADVFQQYADYVGAKIDELTDASNLPLVGTRKEISVRKKCVDILRPIQKQFDLAADGYREEDSKQMPEDNYGYYE